MSHELAAWLRRHRRDRGWPIAEMARQLRQAAQASGDNTVPSRDALCRNIRRWEAGKGGVSERYKLHYCTAFGLPLDEFDPDPPQGAAQRRGDPAGALAAGTPAVAGLRYGRDLLAWPPADPGGYRDEQRHDAVDQPEPPAGWGVPHEWLIAAMAEESQDFGEWADTSNVGDATLEYYAAQVRRLARDFVHAPPYPLLLGAKRLRDRVFTKLQGRQRPDQTRDLYLLASQVCGMLAWMSGELAYGRAAQTHAWTAWVCAEQANHDGARAWVRAAQAKLAYWDARYVESAQLAEDGLRYASAGSVHTLLAAQMARALGRAGRADQAGQAVGRARDERERASGEDEVGGAFGLTAAQYHYMAGSAQLWRHEADDAIAESTRAIELFQQRPPGQRHYAPEALTRIDLASAYLQQTDLDGAYAALRPVLDLSPELRVQLVTQNLGLIRQELATPAFRDATQANEMQEEIETYSRESIVNDLRG